MNTLREMMEVNEGQRGLFARWLIAELKKDAAEVMESAVRFIPASLEDQIEREQNFGKAKALADLVDQIPTKIDLRIKELQVKENQT